MGVVVGLVAIPRQITNDVLGQVEGVVGEGGDLDGGGGQSFASPFY